MKKLLLTIMVFVFGMNMNAADLSVEKNEGDKLPIVIAGSFGKEIVLRGEDPIEIYFHTSTLLINFNASLGELNITIENENGNIVYSSTTNTSLRLVYMIPINNLPTGNYNIIIENNDGSAEASFRIEPNSVQNKFNDYRIR